MNAFASTAYAEPSGEDSFLRGRVLFGRFMTPDMGEHACQVKAIDADSTTLLSSIEVEPGMHIVAYLDEVGRVDGAVSHIVPEGFVVNFNLPDHRRERLRQRLEWLASSEPGADQRRHERYAPKDKISQITLSDGRIYACEVIDISLSGAAVKTDVLPSIGTYIVLGKMRGRVVRHHEHGLAIEFVRQLDPAALAAQTIQSG